MSGDYQFKTVSIGFRVEQIGPNNFEPMPRKHGGLLAHHGHRFQIKDGISCLEAVERTAKLRMEESMSRNMYSEKT